MKRYLFLTMMALVVLSCGKQTEKQQVIPERNVLITRVQDCLYPVRLPAQFRGKRDIAILPQVTATLEEVLVSEGQKVVKGQRMFVLNQTALSAAVDNAEATLAHAQVVVQTQQLEIILMLKVIKLQLKVLLLMLKVIILLLIILQNMLKVNIINPI